MATKSTKDIRKIIRDGKLIDEAMNAAVGDAVQLHKEKGTPLVVWRDGKTILISADEAARHLAQEAPRP